MKPWLVLFWCAALAACAVLVVHHASRYSTAREHARLRIAECEAVAEGLGDLAALRQGGVAASQDDAPNEDGLADAVSKTLAEVGLPPAVLESLAPERGQTVSSPMLAGDAGRSSVTLRRAKASLVLQDLSLPRLGSFIDAFARRRPTWRLTNIDIARDRDAKVTPGEDLPLRAVLILETVVVDTTPPSNQPGGLRR